jgi:hypothetical protein
MKAPAFKLKPCLVGGDCLDRPLLLGKATKVI